MRRKCSCCQVVLPLAWEYDKCSVCCKVSGEWSEEEFWTHIRATGHRWKGDRDKTSSNTMFIPPVWY